MHESSIYMELPIIPTAQMRARRGRGRHMYTAPKQEHNAYTLSGLLEKYVPKNPIENPIILHVTCHMPIPESKPKWWKEAALAGFIKHTSKPDRDNMLKQIKDCMTNMSFWIDDKYVFDGRTEKKYSLNPRWEIVLVPVWQPATKKEYEEIINGQNVNS